MILHTLTCNYNISTTTATNISHRKLQWHRREITQTHLDQDLHFNIWPSSYLQPFSFSRWTFSYLSLSFAGTWTLLRLNFCIPHSTAKPARAQQVSQMERSTDALSLHGVKRGVECLREVNF